jgi:flagellar basal-body rod protein FlgB
MNSLDAAFNFQETALRLRAQRQELLAANIANSDTPNYKARDIDFASALKNAAANNNSNQPATTIAKPSEILYRSLAQGSVDGNTVDTDVERNQFTDNAIRYEASLNFINGDIKDLLSVIQNNG